MARRYTPSTRGKVISKRARTAAAAKPKTAKAAKKKTKAQLGRLRASRAPATSAAARAEIRRLKAELKRLETPKRTQPMTGGKAPPVPTRAQTPGRGRYEIAAQTIAPRGGKFVDPGSAGTPPKPTKKKVANKKPAAKTTKTKPGTGDKARRAVERAASKGGPGTRAPVGGTRGIPRKTRKDKRPTLVTKQRNRRRRRK